jgi:Na+-driven multidrug efflux pump
VFQGLGNTIPAMLSSATRLLFFVPLAVWLSLKPSFHLDQVWWLSVTTLWFQAGLSYLLLRQQFRRRLVDAPRPTAPAVAAAEG